MSADARLLKQWLGAVIVRYPYNAAFTRVNNWGAWARSPTAAIADYTGDDAPLYVQGLVKNQDMAEVDPESRPVTGRISGLRASRCPYHVCRCSFGCIMMRSMAEWYEFS
ncbi:MAG: hypothetical protein U0074_00050 [Kouleothrix sp.]